ncbi:hypothetical protein [Latilactobacillus fuchuensis]|uniref:hypothetical protein n=1 Tax=Latilactobacillus fuchuensis TaxID=164393 RepID=UPI000A6C96B4|nr:hypothetical protein [Latilactobacillus fuchuensis]
MDKESLNIGDVVTGKVTEDMDAPFTGTVEKVYENSASLTLRISIQLIKRMFLN